MKKIICLCFILILFYTAISFEIFSVCKYSDYDSMCDKYGSENVYILKYTYTTGGGWCINQCENSEMTGLIVALYTKMDPRFLRDNDEFELDYMSELLVVSKCTEIVNGESYEAIIYPDKTIIIYPRAETSEYKVCDMSGEGILKFILGIFNRKYWLSC